MEFSKGKEKMVAFADDYSFGSDWRTYNYGRGICCRAIYLHVILGSKNEKRKKFRNYTHNLNGFTNSISNI